MRIVACDAGYTAIFGIEAFAVGDSVWLKSHIQRSTQTHRGYLSPGPVTSTAEFIRLLRRQSPELAHRRLLRALALRFYVIRGWSMAILTGNPGRHRSPIDAA